MLNGDYPREQITGVVLAGGRATRMGGSDKGLIEVRGRPMVGYVAAALRPRVGSLMVSANRNPERYAAICECPIVSDRVSGYAGPLAGMASAMEASATRYLLAAPCDSPLVAPELGPRLYRALLAEDAEISVAHDGTRMQPVFVLLRRELLVDCLAYLEAGERKIDTWYLSHRLAQADLSEFPDMFLNINTPEDRARIEERLA